MILKTNNENRDLDSNEEAVRLFPELKNIRRGEAVPEGLQHLFETDEDISEYEGHYYERKLTEQAKEAAENEKRKADIITEAERDKSEVRTGDHAHDLHTMADKLHEYANAGK